MAQEFLDSMGFDEDQFPESDEHMKWVMKLHIAVLLPGSGGHLGGGNFKSYPSQKM